MSKNTTPSWPAKLFSSLEYHHPGTELTLPLADSLEPYLPDREPTWFAETALQIISHLRLGMDSGALEEMAMESPIEQAFFLAVLTQAHETGLAVDCYAPNMGAEPVMQLGDHALGVLSIQSQYRIGNYRIDFRMSYKDRFRQNMANHSEVELPASLLLVECDGHAYHERTKEQAAKDKKRDRALQDLGLQVYHFTGSEIWADPLDCAVQTINRLKQSYKEQEREATIG